MADGTRGFRQTWAGAYVLASDARWDEHGLVLTLLADERPWRALWRRQRFAVRGRIAAEGLVDGQGEGHIDFHRIQRGEIHYELRLPRTGARAVALRGVQRIRRASLRYSLTTFSAQIVGNNGDLVANAELRLDPLRLPDDLMVKLAGRSRAGP